MRDSKQKTGRDVETHRETDRYEREAEEKVRRGQHGFMHSLHIAYFTSISVKFTNIHIYIHSHTHTHTQCRIQNELSTNHIHAPLALDGGGARLILQPLCGRLELVAAGA